MGILITLLLVIAPVATACWLACSWQNAHRKLEDWRHE